MQKKNVKVFPQYMVHDFIMTNQNYFLFYQKRSADHSESSIKSKAAIIISVIEFI
jgi:hypothetical protein